MLRIVEEKMASNSTTLRLDGSIVGQWVELLRSSCEQVFQSDGYVILDLAGVSFADHEGVQLLRKLEQRQITIINCSPFLREQMKHATKGLSSSGPVSE
ncbi:MAG TPA: STAS domain-containing protein [Blastocatellia bacterium]|nr:STAS domain-containing protein [Blastocatellia bacterium]